MSELRCNRIVVSEKPHSFHRTKRCHYRKVDNKSLLDAQLELMRLKTRKSPTRKVGLFGMKKRFSFSSYSTNNYLF